MTTPNNRTEAPGEMAANWTLSADMLAEVRARLHAKPAPAEPEELAAIIYAIMAGISVATFGTLAAVYELFFTPKIFA